MAGSRANVVVILADDLGYSDIGSYGAEIQTPHLDRLAEEGVPLTQFRNSGRCCPSRASLLTGPLGDAGYHTCISGKWHVGTDER